MSFETILAIISMVFAVFSLFTVLMSYRRSKLNKDKYEHFIYKNKDNKHDSSKYDISKKIKNFEDAIAYIKINSELEELEISYSKHFRTIKALQALGRANRLREKSYIASNIWFYLNSGLIDSVVKNVVYNDDSTEIDRNTVIGLLVGDKIKKDTRSFLYIGVALVVVLGSSLIGISELNYWLVSLLLIAFSLLNLNQKVLEYRISNGLYGQNQYEAREIIGYIENHSNPDDFHDGDNKVFQEKKRKNNTFSGVYGGLLN